MENLINHSELKSVVIVQPAIPDYRIKFFEGLNAALPGRLKIFAGKVGYEDSILSADTASLPVEWISASKILNGKVIWNKGVHQAVMNADVAILGLNPRIVDTWYLTALRRLQGKKTILWGHCWPRAGKKSWTDKVRGVLRGMPDALVLYTQSEVGYLIKKNPRIPVYAARNAIYVQNEMQPTLSKGIPEDVVYVGRITKQKKVDILIKGFSLAVPALPSSARLVVVGDGPEKAACESLVAELNLESRVVFCGHVSDVSELKSIYSGSLCSVSPGYVGLSITQSLGFGVPMVISRDEPHSPEIEAFREGDNGLYFETDSPESLSNVIIEMTKNAELWNSRRSEISRECREEYSVEHMVKSMVTAINEVHGRQG